MKTDQPAYHYKKSRKQRSWLFINMALMCWFYIAVVLGYEYVEQTQIAEPTRQILLYTFSIASLLLFFIAWWHRRHPATYELLVTSDRMIVRYPGSTAWSFDIAIDDINRFESRQTLSHAGQGIAQHGVLLNDGSFHHICLNYGVNLGQIHKAVQRIKPDVVFPSKVNQRVEGLLAKDFDD